MGFRTIVIKNKVKLEYSLNYLICRGEQEFKINIDEISTVIVQNISCAITVALMSKLIEKKINVIFCDCKNNPQFQLIPFHSSFDSYSKINNQIQWREETKNILWKEIIKQKIINQASILKKYEKVNYDLLTKYSTEVEIGDKTNREGHAAKVYFYSLFGYDYSRKDDCEINKYLNYGYSIILSAINREICSFGYLTQIGIHHIGETNPFNLSCDLMEPLRPMVDKMVLSGELNDENFKAKMISILAEKCVFQNKEFYLENAIHLYIQNVLSYMNDDNLKEIEFIKYES